jgi:hypothetical protein
MKFARGSLGLALCRRDAGRQGSDREILGQPAQCLRLRPSGLLPARGRLPTNQSAALVDGLEGRKSLELITALYESIETGEEVHLHFAPKLSRLGVVS